MDLSGTALHIALVTEEERRITDKKRVGHNQSTTTVMIHRQERDADGGPGRSGGELRLNRTQRARPLWLRFSHEYCMSTESLWLVRVLVSTCACSNFTCPAFGWPNSNHKLK